MRTTLALDDELVAKAQAFTGLKEKSSLVREALKALIERESARRLARLGGSEPEIEVCASATAGARLILVDTSVWIDHLRAGSDLLAKLLERRSRADASFRDWRACLGRDAPAGDHSGRAFELAARRVGD